MSKIHNMLWINKKCPRLIPEALITVEAVLVPATVPTRPSVAAVTAVTALAVSVIEPAAPAVALE